VIATFFVYSAVNHHMTINLCARLSACFLVLLLCGSCRKSLGPCTGNCQVIEIAGIALDPGEQKPLGGLSVTVEMPLKQHCGLCSGSTEVVSGKTRADGTFDLKTTVDSTQVGYHICSVTIHGPGNYITTAESVGPGNVSDPEPNVRSMLFFLDSTGVAPYRQYDFFQPVLLTVQLHRVSPILPSVPRVVLTLYTDSVSALNWGMGESASNVDTTATFTTGANIFTRISTTRFITDSTTQDLEDSIRCVPGGANTIQITY